MGNLSSKRRRSIAISQKPKKFRNEEIDEVVKQKKNLLF